MADLVSGRIPFPEDFQDYVDAQIPGMTPYVPVLGGGWTIGNGSIVGNYQKIGDVCTAWGRIILGSTSTHGASDEPSITLPFPLLSQSYMLTGTCYLLDADGSSYQGGAIPNGFQSFTPTFQEIPDVGSGGTVVRNTLVDGDAPFAWGEDDEILWFIWGQVDE